MSTGESGKLGSLQTAGDGTSDAPEEPPRSGGRDFNTRQRIVNGWARLVTFAGIGGMLVAAATHHPHAIGYIAIPAILARILLGRLRLGSGGLPQLPSLPLRGPSDPTRASIGMGASIGRGAQVMPGAVVEMGASVGANAVIEGGAVVRMGASIGAGAVLETGAIVSWGAEVKKGARVCAGARIGAGASIGAGVMVPANTWVMPGSSWHTGPAPEPDASANSNPNSNSTANSNPGSSSSVSPTRAASSSSESRAPAPSAAPENSAPIDPRKIKLDAVFARIDAEIAKSPPLVREHLTASASGVTSLRATCKNLLEREQSLRAESSPDSIARLDAEKSSLAARIAATTDEPVRISLASAVVAIDEQKRQRLLLARSADRLDAELTRLFWTLDGLAAQLLRMRSAGADATRMPDAELTRSVQALQGEIDAIADALEQVARSETAESKSAPDQSAAMPPELAAAPPDASGASTQASKAERERG